MSEKPHSAQTSLLRFLNSNFGLFSMSAIFISLIPFIYTYTQQRNSEIKEKEKNISLLTTEISHRLKTLETLAKDDLRPYQVNDIRIALFGRQPDLKPMYFNFRPIFSEFDNLTLLSLITQLNNITSDKGKTEANRNLLRAVGKVGEHIDILVLEPQNRKEVLTADGKLTLEYRFQKDQKETVESDVIYPLKQWAMVWEDLLSY